MNSFATPEWDSNPIADKTCNELFKGRIASNKKNKKKKENKSKKSEIKAGRVEKAKIKQQKSKSNIKNVESIKRAKQKKTFNPNDNKNRPESFKKNAKNKKQNNEFSPQNQTHKKSKSHEIEDGENNKIKKQKPKVTHQTLFSQTSQRNRSKTNEKQLHTPRNLPELKERITSKKKLKRLKKKQFKANQKGNEIQEENDETDEGNKFLNKNATKTKGKPMQKLKEKLKSTLEESKSFSTTLNKKQKVALPLRERMLEKLKGARFRYLNEQMYTTKGKDAKKYFEGDQNAYQAYHEGYKQQVARWPLNPLDVIIEKIKKLAKTHIIADFGCGEAKLAKSVPQTVHSFDLVAVDELVTACDMAHVPLADHSVNIVVFCLSLMGTNLKDYILEAHRVLKIGGLLKIAEVESRFDNIDDFIKNVQSFGFVKTAKDLSHDLFCFLDFVKKESNVKQKKKLPNVSLNPCLYKKR